MFKRRGFIKILGLTSVGYFGLQETLFANPQNIGQASSFKPIRVRGRVHVSGQGIHRVAVSDGRSVVSYVLF